MAAPQDLYYQTHHCDNDDDELMLVSVSIEEPLCDYLGSFDGTRKNFDDIRPYFDNLFSDDLIHLMDGHPIDKPTFICVIKHLLEQQLVATLEDIYFVDDTHVEYTVHWCNDGHTSMVTHVLALVVDGKIVQIKPCEETKGVFANMLCDCNNNIHLNNRINQFTRIRGWAKKSVQNYRMMKSA